MTKFNIARNQPLARFTSWRIGGIAERYYQAKDLDDLTNFLNHLPESEPITWLGLGSNILFRSSGVLGTVIHTTKMQNKLELLDNNLIRAESGITCAKLSRFAAQNGYDAAFLAGIPGTVGGALAMNAGAFGSETWQFIQQVEIFDLNRQLKILPTCEFYIGYRRVIPVVPNLGFAAGIFQFPRLDKHLSQVKIKNLIAKRNDEQPIGTYNCGSVFRNPLGDHAARLIEQAGLKGTWHGGAQVSPKHANFILNHGKATSDDIEELVSMIKSTVYAKFEIELETEIKFI